MMMLHPEWAGYLAAFDAYVDACARDDEEYQSQSKVVMGWFADELGLVRRLPQRRLKRNIDSLIDLLGVKR